MAEKKTIILVREEDKYVNIIEKVIEIFQEEELTPLETLGILEAIKAEIIDYYMSQN